MNTDSYIIPVSNLDTDSVSCQIRYEWILTTYISKFEYPNFVTYSHAGY
jgi:hypothetical protein